MIFKNFVRRTVDFVKARIINSGGRRPIPNGLVPRHDANEIESDYGNKNKPGLVDLRDFLLLYKAHPSVYSAATDVAQLAASVNVQVQQNEKQIKTGRLAKLFKRPNPHESWNTFLNISMLYLELCGNCFWEILRDDTGQIMAMFVLRPDKMSILPHPVMKVAGYVYRPSVGTDIAYDPSEIIHFKYPDPDNEHWGVGSLEAAKNALMLDFFSSAWNKNFFKNGAEPGGTLETDQSLTDQAFNRLLSTWYKRHKGVKNAHAPAVLEEGLKYRPVTPKHSDMQFDELRKMNKSEVYEAMRVPMDWKENTTKKKSLWMDNIIPKLEMIEQTVNAFLINPEGIDDLDKFQIKFMVRNILSMIEEDAVKSQIANQNVTHGIWTQNEAREILYGMDGVEWGDTYWMPLGLSEWDSGVHAGGLGQAQLPPEHKIDGENKGGDHAGRSSNTQVPKLDNIRAPKVAKANVEPIEYIDIDKIEIPFPTGGDGTDYWAYRKWIQKAKRLGPDERDLINTMRVFFNDQLNRARGNIRANYKPNKEVSKAIGDPLEPNVEAMLLNLTHENQILFNIYTAKATELISKYGDEVMANIGGQIDFDMNTQPIQDLMTRITAEKVSNINRVTRELMKRSLIEAVQKGEDFEDAMRRLQDIFAPEGGISNLRARRIARTELITFTNTATLESMKQSGLVEKKMWVSYLLPTTRQKPGGENHVVMHKKVIGIHEHFEVPSRSGTDSMDGPGDGTASAENLVNCLCFVTAPPTAPELQDIFEEAIERPSVRKVVGKGPNEEEEVKIYINVGDKKTEEIDVKKSSEPKEVKPYIINNVINIPEQKMPDINFNPTIEVKPTDINPVFKVAAPTVPAPNIEIKVEKQDTPIVNVTNTVPQGPAPIVNVESELHMPDSTEVSTVERDGLGKIVSTSKKKTYNNKKKPKKQ